MTKKILLTTFASAFVLLMAASQAGAAPADDSHNHDGSHPDLPTNCGPNYMLPGSTARLGSHSFMILAREDETHVLVEHRSGTPPHAYQFLLRVRLDKAEMDDYVKLAAISKTLPAFTTIYFDADGKQLDRSFFCLPDLARIFGPDQKKGDEFDKLFPIRASLQKDADHEGSFEIGKSVYRGHAISLERADVEIVMNRYLPAYLPQTDLRTATKNDERGLTTLFAHHPLFPTEKPETAQTHRSYMDEDGKIGTPGRFCQNNYYLPKIQVKETIHSFMLMNELGGGDVLAVHYYDYAPQNFQTSLVLKLSDAELELYRQAKKDSRTPPLLQTRLLNGDGSTATFTSFCMENIRTLASDKQFKMIGTIFRDADLVDYKIGTAVGTVQIPSSGIRVLVNRRLESDESGGGCG